MRRRFEEPEYDRPLLGELQRLAVLNGGCVWLGQALQHVENTALRVLGLSREQLKAALESGIGNGHADGKKRGGRPRKVRESEPEAVPAADEPPPAEVPAAAAVDDVTEGEP